MRQILITGGTGGLSLTRAYLMMDYAVTVLDDEPEDTRKSSPPAGLTRHLFDVANFDERQLDDLPVRYDVVICNAGVSTRARFEETPIEDVREVFAVNVHGPCTTAQGVVCTRADKSGRTHRPDLLGISLPSLSDLYRQQGRPGRPRPCPA